MKKDLISKKERKLIYILSFAGLFFASVILCHRDAYSISGWAKNMAECILNGRFLEFPRYSAEGVGVNCDYRIIVSLFFGLWELPIALVGKIAGIADIPSVVYMIWFKMLLVIVVIITTKLLKRLLTVYANYDDCDADVLLLTFINSSFVVIAFIGQGQIDGLAFLVFLLGLLYVLVDRQLLAGVCISIAVLIKPFGLIFFFPLVIYYLYRNRIILGRVIVSLIALPAINYLFERFVFVGFREAAEASEASYIPRFYDTSIHSNPVFFMCIFLILGIMILWCLDGSINIGKSLFMTGLSFLSFEILVEWHPQWFVYMIPVLLFMIFDSTEQEELRGKNGGILYVLLFLGINICFMISIASNYRGTFDTELIEKGLIGYIKAAKYEGYPLIAYIEGIYNYIHETAKAGISAALIFITLSFGLTVKRSGDLVLKKKAERSDHSENDDDPDKGTRLSKTWTRRLLIYGTALPTYAYVAASLFLYIRK